MPTGTPYNSFVLPYRIRVDDFATSANQETIPALHLLTHTHSDHINGLQAKSFGYTVICSHDAKEMLLRHEVYAERSLHEMQYRAEKTRTYSHLKVDPLVQPDGSMYYTGSRDLLKPLPLHTPTQIELSNEETVIITLFDANHCPGAVMFLIEGDQGAVLHTGDFRAEPWFLESLTHNPFLQPYIAARNTEDVPASSLPRTAVVKTLDVIYLDTACLLSSLTVPSKERATSGLVELLKLFPPTTYFFINTWTWGYEDILKAIARVFQCQIHFDRYKYSIYTHISDPLLRSISTSDASSTRFHACERFDRCSHVAVDDIPGFTNSTSHEGHRVVYVNPVTMGSASWDLYLQETKLRLGRGDVINNLLVPLSRHSPLPELQAFVSLFQPRRVVPNTLIPGLHGLDWACIDKMFADCLSKQSEPSGLTFHGQEHLELLKEEGDAEMDTALMNLVGDGATDLAAKWAESGKLRKKLDVVRGWLGTKDRVFVDRILNSGEPNATAGPSRLKGARHKLVESDEETDCGSEDERGKTAHRLFASFAGIQDEQRWFPSSSPDTTGTFELGINPPTPVSSPVPRRPQLKGKGVKRHFSTTSCSPRTPYPLKRPRLDLASPIQLPYFPALPVGQNHDTFSSKSRRSTPQKAVSLDPAPLPLKDIDNLHPPKRPSSSTTPPDENIVQNDDRPKIKMPPPSTAKIMPPHTSSSTTPTTPRRMQYPRPQDRTPVVSRRIAAGPPDSSAPLPSLPPRRRSESRSPATRRSSIAERLKIAEHLALALPERVVPSYHARRARLMSSHVKLEAQTAYDEARGKLPSSFETVYDEGEKERSQVDWERSREIAEEIREDLRNGRRPVMPALTCTESQIES